MANIMLELNINSASNLVNVNRITKTKVYAVITIEGDDSRKKQKVKTTVDRSGGSNPTWNYAVKFPDNELLAHDGRLTLVMRFVSRGVLRNKNIAGVNVPLLELLNSNTPSINGMKLMTYQVRTPSGKRSGTLTFSYRFEPDLPVMFNRGIVDTTANSQPEIEQPPSASLESPIEYPKLSQPPSQNALDHRKQPVAADSSYDFLPVSYSYVLSNPSYLSSSPCNHISKSNTQVPSQSYGAYFEPYGYASPSPVRYGNGSPSYPQSKGIGLGLGLGLGLGAGILSGMVTGDIVSDVANCYDL